MRRLRVVQIVGLVVTLFIAGIGMSSAQDIVPETPAAPDAEIAITFPPPVYVVRDTIQVRGSVTAENLSNYFVEFRPFEFAPPVTDATGATATPEAERPWFPATLPQSQPVDNGVLGSWNTTTTQDGLYELRLVVNRTDGGSDVFEVRPVRVENNPPPFLDVDSEDGASPDRTLVPTPDSGSSARPTIAATPTSLNQSPTVTAVVDANVRRGDSTAYPRVTFLLQGDSAPVLGISPDNGWYYIEVDQRRGFIAPSTVRFEGNASNLTIINPPATPTPTPTNTPVPTGNLQITGLRLDPASPTCGDAFDVLVNVTNTGSSRTNSSGILTVTDSRASTNSQQGSTIGGFPQLDPGQNFVVVTTLTISTFVGEEHRIVANVDSNNQITETNENDNVASRTYILQSGC